MFSHDTTAGLAQRVVRFLNTPVPNGKGCVELLEGWAGAAAPIIWDPERLQRDARRVLAIKDREQRRALAARFLDQWTSGNVTQGIVRFIDGRLVLEAPLLGGVNEAVAITLLTLTGVDSPGTIQICRLCSRCFYDDRRRRGRHRLNCPNCQHGRRSNNANT